MNDFFIKLSNPEEKFVAFALLILLPIYGTSINIIDSH